MFVGTAYPKKNYEFFVTIWQIKVLFSPKVTSINYFDRDDARPLDEAIGNEASLARMTAIGAVETVCFHVARAAGEVDNLGLPAPATRKGD